MERRYWPFQIPRQNVKRRITWRIKPRLSVGHINMKYLIPFSVLWDFPASNSFVVPVFDELPVAE